MSNFWNKDGLVVDVIKTSNGVKYITEDDVKSVGGHTVGEQWISFDGTIPEGGVPFFGQELNIALYTELYEWAKQNNRVISDSEWLSINERNNGNVPYYSSGNGHAGGKAHGYIIYPISEDGTYVLKIGTTGSSWPLSQGGTPEYLVDAVNNGSFGSNLQAEYEEITYNDSPAIKISISSTNYSSHYNNYSITSVEDTYHQISDFSGGHEVIEGTTFRMPKFNGYFKANGTTTIEYIQEGLPNITGKAGPWENIEGYALMSEGALGTEYDAKHTIGGGGTGKYYFATLDASKSNAIYGNSEHVTPETSTVIVGVWAFNSFQNASDLDMSDLKEALSVANTYDSMPLLSHRWDYKGMGNAGWVRADGYWLDGDLYVDAYNKLVELDSNPNAVSVLFGNYTTAQDLTAPHNFLIDTTNRKFRLPIFSHHEKYLIDSYTDTYGNKCSFFSDGSIKIEGQHNTTTTSATVYWTTSVNTDYKLTLTETCKTNKSTDTEGFTAYAAPSNYESNSFRLTTYKDTSRFIEWKLEGTPIVYEAPYSAFFYFKLGNTFINEGEMNASEISDKIDRVWDSWQDADYVVDSYTNGTEWYRLYKSGWLEQGGEIYHSVKEEFTVNLLLPYSNSNYFATKTTGVNGIYTDSASLQYVTIFDYTTTSFKTKNTTATGLNNFRWYACGQSNQ